jgi:hypothetical protein
LKRGYYLVLPPPPPAPPRGAPPKPGALCAFVFCVFAALAMVCPMMTASPSFKSPSTTSVA